MNTMEVAMTCVLLFRSLVEVLVSSLNRRWSDEKVEVEVEVEELLGSSLNSGWSDVEVEVEEVEVKVVVRRR